MLLDPFLLFKVFSFLAGAIFGSYFNVLILRLPEEKNTVSERSHCPKCNKLIVWYENIPIVSWLFLRGKCSQCKNKISFQYPLIEIITGVIAVLLFPDSFSTLQLGHYVINFFIISMLLVHFVIDVRHQILPDKINLALLVLAILKLCLDPSDYIEKVLGALVGFGSTYLVTYLFYKWKGKIGLGGGDIKLYGVIGLLIGVKGVLTNIFLSSFLGSIVMITLIVSRLLKREDPIAFGPFIIIILTIQLYFPALIEKLNLF